MSTIMHVRAGNFLANLRMSRNDKKTAVSERVRKGKDWVTNVEAGNFDQDDIDLIVRAYGLDNRNQGELQKLLRQDVQSTNTAVEVAVGSGV